MEYADKNLCIGDCKPPAPRYGHKSKSSSRKWDTAAHRHILLQTSQIVHIYTLTYYSTAPGEQNTGLFSLFFGLSKFLPAGLIGHGHWSYRTETRWSSMLDGKVYPFAYVTILNEGRCESYDYQDIFKLIILSIYMYHSTTFFISHHRPKTKVPRLPWSLSSSRRHWESVNLEARSKYRTTLLPNSSGVSRTVRRSVNVLCNVLQKAKANIMWQVRCVLPQSCRRDKTHSAHRHAWVKSADKSVFAFSIDQVLVGKMHRMRKERPRNEIYGL